MEKSLSKICNIIVATLVVVSLCITGVYAYYHYYVKPQTVGVNYIDNQVPVDLVEKSSSLTDAQREAYEKRVLLEANYYSNTNTNGIVLQEMRLNYFTDTSLGVNACRSSGLQHTGKCNWKAYGMTSSSVIGTAAINDARQMIYNTFNFYDTTDMVSWSGYYGSNNSISAASTLNREDVFIVKIDDKPFQIQLTGSASSAWLGISRIWYNWGDIFAATMLAIESNNQGFGDYYISLDLSRYLTVRAYDEATGTFGTEDADIVKTYALVKFHYDANGAKKSTQSIFGIIDCNPAYDLDNKTDAEYSQSRIVYTLTETTQLNNEEVFAYRYSEIYDGYFVSLTSSGKTTLNGIENKKINIKLNLNSDYFKQQNKTILGIDYSGFEGLEIDTLSVSGEGDFTLLANSLKDTQLKTLRHSQGVNLIISNNATSAEFEEVII